MAYDLKAIPLTLTTTSGSFGVDALAVSWGANIRDVVVRAKPKDWVQRLWMGGHVSFSGLLKATGAGQLTSLPGFASSIELAGGQKVYECRLVESSMSPGTSPGGRAFVNVAATYEFLTYDSASPLVFGGSAPGSSTAAGRWLDTFGSRGDLNTSSGRLTGFGFHSAKGSRMYAKYDGASLPTALPMPTGAKLTVQGVQQWPRFYVGTQTLAWVEASIESPSGAKFTAEASEAVVTSQTMEVKTTGGMGLLWTTIQFTGSLPTSWGSHSSEWYY